MEFSALVAFLSAGFGLGMLHALDPDHLAAVGGVSVGNSEHKKYSRFAMEWSLGHGAALFLISIVVLMLGTAIPKALSHYAELSIALILIIIGALGLYKIYGRGLNYFSSQLNAPIVGLFHGTAGSAPLLAIIPLSQLPQPIWGLYYVLLFCTGVMIAMVLIGNVLGLSLRLLFKQYAPLVGVIHTVMALFSIFLGVYLMIVAK